MRYWHSPSDIMVLPETLWDFAWSAPMRDLAAKLDLSDIGLKKILTSHGVATPPQGHWNRVHAGKDVIGRPKLPPRQPGGTGRLQLDARFAAYLPSAPPIPVDGPFASAAVPEDLEELRAIQLKALGRVTAPATLDRYAPGLQSIMRSEARRREKSAGSPYHWDLPKFDNPVAKRRLRILNAIFLALAKRGHSGSADERDGEIHARAIVGDTSVSLDLSISGKHRTVKRAGYDRADPGLPLSTPHILRVDSSSNNQAAEVWQDDATGKLEARIAAITAGIIVAGEARFRRGLREAVERLERYRIAEEEARQRQLTALNVQRLADLKTSGELLRQSEDIRALVTRVKAAVATGSTSTDQATLTAWEAWALGEADRLDPVISGQIESHLHPPSLI